jgi:hypothetical protein
MAAGYRGDAAGRIVRVQSMRTRLRAADVAPCGHPIFWWREEERGGEEPNTPSNYLTLQLFTVSLRSLLMYGNCLLYLLAH